MIRSDLRDLLNEKISLDRFLLKIIRETEQYRKNLNKKGGSCPIIVDGDESYTVEKNQIMNLNQKLEYYPFYIRDYILTGILLDEFAEKDEETIDILEDLTAPEG